MLTTYVCNYLCDLPNVVVKSFRSVYLFWLLAQNEGMFQQPMNTIVLMKSAGNDKWQYIYCSYTSGEGPEDLVN